MEVLKRVFVLTCSHKLALQILLNLEEIYGKRE